MIVCNLIWFYIRQPLIPYSLPLQMYAYLFDSLQLWFLIDQVFTFTHPEFSDTKSNQRYKKLYFEIPSDTGSAIVHGMQLFSILSAVHCFLLWHSGILDSDYHSMNLDLFVEVNFY